MFIGHFGWGRGGLPTRSETPVFLLSTHLLTLSPLTRFRHP